jgi:hypothetical protein
MRRRLSVAILCGLLAASPAAIAQRGGAGHFGGHAGSFAGGGFHGGLSAPRSFAGSSGARFSSPRSSSFGYSSFAQRGFSPAPRMSPSMAPRMTWTAPRYTAAPRYNSAFRPAYGAGRRGGNRGGRYPYRPPYRGGSGSGYGAYAYPYSYADSWELLPGNLDYSDFTGYGDNPETDQSPDQADQQPEYQPQYQAGPPPYPSEPEPPYPSPPGPNYVPPSASAAAPAAPPVSQPEITLIFQDGHTQTIRNYMLTPSAVIVMDQAASGREPSIPLSELNLPATEQAARQAGLDFSPPTS